MILENKLLLRKEAKQKEGYYDRWHYGRKSNNTSKNVLKWKMLMVIRVDSC